MADTASTQEANKFAALQSMAAGNSYDAGSDQIKASQGTALSGLASTAAKIGAPQAAQDQWSGIASAPYESALSNLAAGHGQQASSNAALDRIWSDYSGAAAGAPIYGKGLAYANSGGVSGGLGGAANAYRGGYPTDASYVNAVTAMAQQAAQQAAQDSQAQHDSLIQQFNQAAIPTDQADQNAAQRARFLHGESDEATRNANAQHPAAPTQQGPTSWSSGQNTVSPVDDPTYDPTGMHGGSTPAYAAPALDPAAAQAAQQRAQADAAAMQRNYAAAVGQQQQVSREGLAVRAQYAPQWEAAATARQQAADPLNLYQFARDQAINGMGADPANAMGLFDPTWAAKLATGDLTGQTGYATAQEQYNQMQANKARYGLAVTDAQLQAMQPTNAQQTQAAQASPEYGIAAQKAEELLALVGTGGLNAQGQPVTVDDLKQALAAAGASADVAAAIISTYGPLFPAAGYYSRPAVDPTQLAALGG